MRRRQTKRRTLGTPLPTASTPRASIPLEVRGEGRASVHDGATGGTAYQGGGARTTDGRSASIGADSRLGDRETLPAVKAITLRANRRRVFDVFLCYNRADRAAVKDVAERLSAHGIRVWLDEWEIRPGKPWLRLLEGQISRIRSAAVFIGGNGLGPWQEQEIEALLREFVSRGLPVIPVLLAQATEQPRLPLFLRGMGWVDLRLREPNPVEELIWGITGMHPRRNRSE